jgi:hypothetical protein
MTGRDRDRGPSYVHTYSSRLLTWANVASFTSHGVAARGLGRSCSQVLIAAGMSAQSAMSSA